MEFDCGTGAGGFKEGNTCATGGDGGDREERRRDRIEGTDEEVKVERQKTNRIISRAKKFIEDGKKYSEAAKRNMDAAATNEKLISKYKEYKDKFNDGKFDKEYSEATKRATEYYKAASEYSQKAKGLFDKALKEEGRARARREKGFEEIEPSSENLEVKKKETENPLEFLNPAELKMLIAGMMGGIELGKYDGIDFTPPTGSQRSR